MCDEWQQHLSLHRVKESMSSGIAWKGKLLLWKCRCTFLHLRILTFLAAGIFKVVTVSFYQLKSHKTRVDIQTIKASGTLQHRVSHGLAITLRMRTTISPGQGSHGQLFWPCRTSSEPQSRRAETGLKALRSLPFTAETGAKHPFRRQLHTTHARAVGFGSKGQIT